MWIGLILLVIVIVVVWWLLTRNVRLSEEEAPRQSETHELEAVHAVIEHPVSATEAKMPARVESVSAEPMAPDVPAVEMVEDDLIIIEGIGPKINDILKMAGIKTFSQLAAAKPEDLKKLLTDAGLRLGDPTTWPEQARMAAAGDMEGLQKYQDSLKGGRVAN